MTTASTEPFAFRSDRHRAIAWLGFLILLLSLLAPQLSIESAEAAQTLTTQQEECDDGFSRNERTGECEPDPQRVPGQITTECPAGTTREAQTGACIPVTETAVPETETAVVTEPATEVPATETATEAATEPPPPPGYAQAIKRACPDDFVPDATTTITDFQTTCLDPVEGILFHLTIGGVPYSSVPTDPEGLSQLGAAPVGEIALVEEIPDGFGEPVVYCAEGYAFGPFEHTYTEADRQPVLDGNAIAWTLPADTLLQCYVYNIAAEDPEGPSDITTQNEIEGGEEIEHQITLTKRTCPEGTDPDAGIGALIATCAITPDVEFTLEYDGATTSGTTDENGVVSWDGIPYGEYEIFEPGYAGYTLQSAHCHFEDLPGPGAWIHEFTEGVYEGSFPPGLDPEGDPIHTVCDWFNFDDGEGATVMVVKHRCPLGVPEDLTVAEYTELCTAMFEGIDFTIDHTDGSFPGTTGEDGRVHWYNVPAGDIDIQEEIPEGYEDPLAFCVTFEGVQELESSEGVATGGLIEMNLPDEATAAVCWVVNIPDPELATSLTVNKWRCPSGYDEDTGDPEADCTEPMDDVTFHLAGMAATTGEGAPGQAVFLDVPTGEHMLTEDAPEGIDHAFVGGCEVNGEAAPLLVPLSDFPSIGIAVEAGNHWTCEWYNVPAVESRVVVHKRICPEGVDFVLTDENTIDDMINACSTEGDGIEFTLDHAGGSSTQATVDGTTLWDGVPNGPITITEHIPPGYEEPVWYCMTNPKDAAGDLGSGSPWELQTAPGGVIDATLDEPYGEVFGCWVFNRTGDDGDLIVHKWVCPPGYDVHAEGADPKVDCTETAGSITFQFGQPGLGEEAVLQDAGDFIEDGVLFNNLEPGDWRLVEFAPDWVESAFIGSCTVNGSPVPANPPIHEGLEWDIDIDAGEVIECDWYNVPSDDNVLIVHKKLCPAGFDVEVDDPEANCTEPMGGVTFNLGDMDATTGDDQGVAVFEDVPAGEFELTEILPDGIAYAFFTHCTTQFGPILMPPVGAQPPVAMLEFDAGSHLDCYWYNVPEVPEDNEVEIHKWQCPEGTGYDESQDWYETNCTDVHNGVKFTVTSDIGIAVLETAGGTASFPGLPADTVGIQETIPDGFGPPIVFCWTDGPDGWQPHDAPTGYWEFDFLNDGVSTNLLKCFVFNIPGDPPSITIHKWTCPPSYDVHAEGADPKTDCTEATNGVQFQFGLDSLAAIAELQTTGDIIDGGVVFDDLDPGIYKAVEIVPEGIGSVFVLECTGHIMGVLQPTLLSTDNVLEDIDLDAGEHLVCDWYNVPEDGGKLTVIKYICATETFVSAVDCEIYEGGATFNLLWWDGAAWQVVATETTDGFGRIVWTDVDAGDYWLDEHDGAWCHITSTPAGDDDSFPVSEGEETVVEAYNCDPGWVPDDTPEKYPNTGVPSGGASDMPVLPGLAGLLTIPLSRRRLAALAAAGLGIAPIRATAQDATPDATPAASPERPCLPATPDAAGDLGCERGAVPATLRIDAIDVDAPVEILEVVGGVMQQPTDEVHVAWYKESARLGERGNLWLAGHLNWWTTPIAVFTDLGLLREGDAVVLLDADGTAFTYTVDWVRQESNLAPPREEVLGMTDHPAVTLITCSGEWNNEISEYDARTVVRAVATEPADM